MITSIIKRRVGRPARRAGLQPKQHVRGVVCLRGAAYVSDAGSIGDVGCAGIVRYVSEVGCVADSGSSGEAGCRGVAGCAVGGWSGMMVTTVGFIGDECGRMRLGRKARIRR